MLLLEDAPAIHLRAADRFDAEALAQLRAKSLVEMGLLAPAEADAFGLRAVRAFRELFDAGRLVAWVVCDGEHAVGSSCAVFYDRLPYPDGSRHAELGGVYVEPAYRERGYASELVSEVVATARGEGARKVFLRPSPAGKALYVRLGFVDTELMTFVRSAPGREASDPALAASLQR